MLGDVTDLAINKLIILYILNKLNKPVTNSTLTQIVLENNLINYFSLQQYISELINAGFINTIKDNKKQFLILSNKGIDTLNFFFNRIPNSKIEQLDDYLENTSDDKNKITYTFEYSPTKSGFEVLLILKQSKNNILELKIPAKTLDEVQIIKNNWQNKNAEIYEKVTSMLFK